MISKTSPDIMHGVTKNQWIEYEQLRRSGIMNMLSSREVLGMDKQAFVSILKHFNEMENVWKIEVPDTNPFIGKQLVTRLE